MPYDVIVVGAGIVGMAHAWRAAALGLRVLVLDRSPQAAGASVRNFGMVWPIGQPPGVRLETALRSRELWLEFLAATRLPHFPDGSLHAAYFDDEQALCQEFAAVSSQHGYQCRWLSRDEALAASPWLVPDGSLGSLRGALWSATEVIVDPRQALATLPGFLSERYGVTVQHNEMVRAVGSGWVETTVATYHAPLVIVATGVDFAALYPDLHRQSGIVPCKLQMLRTVPQSATVPGTSGQPWRMGPALAAGLTMRFYTSFGICQSLPPLARRIAETMPQYDHFGIHVMASATPNGEITLGDSHEYGDPVPVFNKEEIDNLILSYLDGFARFPNRQIAERWYGVYAKHPQQPWVHLQPEPGVHIVNGLGGAGMTMSFGVADRLMPELCGR